MGRNAGIVTGINPGFCPENYPNQDVQAIASLYSNTLTLCNSKTFLCDFVTYAKSLLLNTSFDLSDTAFQVSFSNAFLIFTKSQLHYVCTANLQKLDLLTNGERYSTADRVILNAVNNTNFVSQLNFEIIGLRKILSEA